METMPVVWQYAILGAIGLIGALTGLWLYNRREKRRKHALELAKLMNQWGMGWFAEAYEMYAVGDYSGLAVKIKEVVQAVRSDEAMALKLFDVARKVCAYVAANDATKAEELIAVLQTKK
ncbi:MAG: hypothetical protein JW959_11790 [Pirellulales bacterium]|nr:hypothetical protein [Pirellulales bacterium]